MAVGELPKGVEVNKSGKPSLPGERFSSADEMRDCCQQLISADEKYRAGERTRVEGVIAGNSPVPQTTLNAKQLGWFPNCNYREAEGLMQAMQTPLYDLVTEVDHCVEINLDLDTKQYSRGEREAFEDCIQRHYTWLMLNSWRKNFNLHIPKQQRTMIIHGLGAHAWLNNRWTPRTPSPDQLLFPDNCGLNIDEECKYFLLREWVNGEDLYGYIRNEKESAKLGWKPDQVWESLVNASKNRSSGKLKKEDMQARMRSGDIGFSQTSQAGIWFNHVVVEEYEGGYSHYIIDEEWGNEYLYRKRYKFDEIPLVLFPYDIGDGKTIHSIKGLGVRSRIFFELSNRLKNIMAAQVIISAFPQLKQTTPNLDTDKLKLMRFGALTITPYGLEPNQIQFPPLQNSGIALSHELERTLESNNQSMSGAVPEPKDRETKYSFMLRSQDSARVSNGMLSNYESNLQQYHEKTLRMVMDTSKGDMPHQKLAEKFRQRCMSDEYGVPREVLRSAKIAEVRAITSSGAGSPATRLHNLMMLMDYVYPNTTEEKKITIERDLVSNAMGSALVDRYARSIKDNQTPDNEDSFIAVESDVLANGGEAVVGSDQNDARHAAGALQKAAGIVEAVQAGQSDPQQAIGSLQRLLDHAGIHIQKLQGNPRKQAEFKQLADQWQEIAKAAKQIQVQAEALQGQQEAQQQLSEKGQLQLQSDQQENARKDAKLAGNEQRANIKLNAGLQRDAVKTAAQINGQRQKAAFATNRA